MRYLDAERLRAVDVAAFRATKPYPYVNPKRLLTDQGFAALYENLPDLKLFNREFGIERSHGQAPHDRYALEYRDDLPISPHWHNFIAELRGLEYRRFMRQMYDTRFLSLTFHWHYAPNGCSVSPHCDAIRKLGSHIFYFNTEKDWKEEWGGQTLVLDDAGRFPRKSAPRFEDFDHEFAAEGMGNRSFIFARGDSSWHGVREINCPEGHFRRVFIVVVEDKRRALLHSVLDPLRGKKRARY
jgi:hypothetical protein